MKTLLAVLLLTFATGAFAQSSPPTSAVAPGCGTADTKFDVSTSNSPRALAKPDAGKALIYFLQDDTYFDARPRPTTRFAIDGTWIGATHGDSYFHVSIDPGEHHLCANWQSYAGPVGLGIGPDTAAAHFNAEPGGIYFFAARNHGGLHSGLAGIELLSTDSDQAQLLMSRFALASSRPKK
jgi:hypothetical protein